MKYLFTLFLLCACTVMHTQTLCYTTYPPFKVVNGSAISQQFTCCQTGSAITIRTYMAVYPFLNNEILFTIYNDQNVAIGVANYWGDMMVYDYQAQPQLPDITVTIECNVVAGQTYRWEASQCCQTDGGNNLPIYIIMQETATDQVQGNVTFQFISPQGVQQNSFTNVKDIRAFVYVHKYYNACPCDCNENGYLDIEDAMCLIGEHGNTCSTGSVVCDMDGDCDVDDADLNIFKLHFGDSCP